MKFIVVIILSSFLLYAQAQKWPPVNGRFDSLARLCEHNIEYFPSMPELEGYVEEMKEIALNSDDVPVQWRTLYWEGALLLERNEGKRAIEIIDSALAIVDSTKYTYDYMCLKVARCFASSSLNYLDRYKTAKKALKYFTEIGDTLRMARMCLQIGFSLKGVGLPDKALEYYLIAKKYLKESNYCLDFCVYDFTLIEIYMLLGEIDKAKQIYMQMLSNPETKRNPHVQINLLQMAYKARWDTVAPIKEYELAIRTGDPRLINGAQLNLAHMYYLYKGEPEKAILYYRKALDDISDNDFDFTLKTATALNGLYKSYAMLDRSDSAFYFSERFHKLADSISFVNDHAKLQTEIEKYQLEKQETEIQRTKEEARTKFIIVILCCGLLLIGACSYIVVINSRKRVKEAKNKQLEAEMEAISLERMLMAERCANNERQLVTNNLLLLEKHNMIDHLNKQIEESGQEGKIEPKVKRDLLNYIKLHKGTEDSLTQFYDFFNRVHPKFFQQLKERYPDLTKSDLRLCAYLRIGLDNKQIAQILKVQPEAIKQARYRLRKKLRMQTSDSLDDFFSTFPKEDCQEVLMEAHSENVT